MKIIEKEVQDTSCRGGPGVSPKSAPQAWGIASQTPQSQELLGLRLSFPHCGEDFATAWDKSGG